MGLVCIVESIWFFGFFSDFVVSCRIVIFVLYLPYYDYHLGTCLFSNERETVADPGGWKWEYSWKTIIRIYCMKKVFSIKEN